MLLAFVDACVFLCVLACDVLCIRYLLVSVGVYGRNTGICEYSGVWLVVCGWLCDTGSTMQRYFGCACMCGSHCVNAFAAENPFLAQNYL